MIIVYFTKDVTDISYRNYVLRIRFNSLFVGLNGFIMLALSMKNVAFQVPCITVL